MPYSLVDEEFPIATIPSRQYWGENYVLVFFDHAARLGGLLSMGRWVIQPKLWRNMSYLSLPNDRVLLSKNYGKSFDPRIPDSGVFRMEILNPGKRIGYFYDGPVDERTMTDINTGGYRIGRNDLLQFELEFNSDAPIWDMHSGLAAHSNTETPEANFNSPEGHIEQNGHISGSIRYGTGEVFKIQNAPATRDHSRGVRNFTNYKGHIWTNGVFPSGKSFHCFTLRTHGFDGIAAGRCGVLIEGNMYDATLSQTTEGWLESPDQLFKPFTLRIDSKVRGEQEIRATHIQDSVPLALTMPADHYWGVPTQSRLKQITWVNEQKVTWQWGDEIGHGHLERGNSKFNSTDSAWLQVFGKGE
jgi:hypothetical protein